MAAMLVAALAAACSRPDRIVTVDTLISDLPAVATLSVDRTQAATTGIIRVSAAFGTGTASATVGAFTMRLAYDATRLIYDPAASSVAGTGAINETGGVVNVAAVALSGFPPTALFTATFKLREPGASTSAGTLRLTVAEISGVDFTNQLPADASRLTIIAQ